VLIESINSSRAGTDRHPKRKNSREVKGNLVQEKENRLKKLITGADAACRPRLFYCMSRLERAAGGSGGVAVQPHPRAKTA